MILGFGLPFLQRLSYLSGIIQTNHIHNENDKLVFYRYKNANNESIRKHILKRIEEGKTEWKSLLEDFPLPDKPFNIEDIEDILGAKRRKKNEQ